MTREARGRGRARRHTEDRARAPNVRVHARLGDPQEARDLLRGEAARDRTKDLTLTIGQRGD
jgi:hypothetical protein